MHRGARPDSATVRLVSAEIGLITLASAQTDGFCANQAVLTPSTRNLRQRHALS
jgi:hypothetical protein